MAPHPTALRPPPPPPPAPGTVPGAPVRWVRLRSIPRTRVRRPWWLLHLVEVVTHPNPPGLELVIG